LELLAGAWLTFLSGAGLGGLAFAHVGAAGVVAGVALSLAGVRPGRSFDPGLLKISAPIGLAIFLSLLAFKIDLPLLQWLDGRAAEVGLYNAAYRLFEPLLLFPAAILAGVFPGLARRALSPVGSAFSSQTARLLLVLLGSGVLAGGLLGLNAAWPVGWLYGPDYAAAAPTLSLLGLAVPFLFVNSGLTYLLLAIGHERYNLYFFAVALLVNIGSNLLLIPLWGRNGAAVATLLTEASLTSLTGLALLRTLKKPSTALPAHRPSLLKRPGVTLRRVGFGALLVLVFGLPFEFTQQPVISAGFVTLSNLELVYYVVIGLAILTLGQARRRWRFNLSWSSPVLWLALLLLVCALSTAFSVAPVEGLKFSLNVGLGGLLWLAIPGWLGTGPQRQGRLGWLARVLVAGAALSAGLGLLEFWPDLNINNWLLSPFKAGATVAGPFLRLSGTFEYANTAAMYYELALPFALAGLAQALGGWLAGRKAVYPPGRPARLIWLSGKWWQVGLWLAATALLWQALVLSFSRSALPGMLVAGPVLWWLTRGKFKRQQARWGLGLGLAVGVGLIGLNILVSPVLVLRFKSESDQAWFKASYSAPALTNLAACQVFSVPVTVNNLTPLDWRGGRNGPYQLSYHWLDRPDHIAVFEGARSDLPAEVKAGQAVVVQAELHAPVSPGQYWLVWDVVEENVSWFSLKSAFYAPQPVEVGPDSTRNCANSAPDLSPIKSPASLPVTPPNPERSRLWKVAVQMITARPWLGVGPDGYRFAYGQYAGQSEWDTRIFANSTPLELLADLGLVGGTLAGLFLGLVLWPALKRGWRGRLTGWEGAALTALVAFGLHGLFDYFLGFHAIFILFWLLLGLAGRVRPPALASKKLAKG
jgi:hypothetical protein